MNAPSRQMEPMPASQKPTLVSWLVVVAILSPLVWLAVASAPLRWIVIGSFTLMAVLTILHRRWLKRIKEERKEESICTFSRALPAKDHDTWVVRAAYEEISHHAEAPIRPSDNVVKFWGIDGDDLDDAILRIARRARRSMADVQKNPFCGRAVTVADVIAFVEHQPREPIQGITDNSGAAPLCV